MVWGGNDNAVQKWVRQLETNDPKLTSLHILSFRRIEPSDLAKIFIALTRNTFLKQLHCSGHALDSAAADRLAEALKLNKTLEILNIGDARLGHSPAIFKTVCNGLEENEGVISLDLENKGLTEASSTILAKCLEVNKTLKELCLSRNAIDDRSLESLTKALASHPTICKLNLSMNNLGPRAAEIISSCLANSRISELDLSNNPLMGGAKELAKMISNNQYLHTLKMVDVVGLPDEPEELPASVKDTDATIPDQIEKSTLSSASSVHGNALLLAIANVLPTSRLTNIYLDNNGIESEAVVYLAENLPRSQLTDLHLRKNRVGDTGAGAIAGATCKLRFVDLSENNVGCKGLGELLSAPLEYVGLFRNQVAGFGAQPELLPDLRTSGIVKLDIGCNKVMVDDMKAIVQVLLNRGAPNLTQLEMGGNAEENDMELWDEEIAQLEKQRPEIKIIWKRRTEEKPPMASMAPVA